MMTAELSSKSLFVISQIGQLRSAQELVRTLGLTDVSIAILYTKKNLNARNDTEAAVDRTIFSEVFPTEIHPASNSLNLRPAKHAFRTYSELLNRVQPKTIFVCSFERHYAILCEVASNRGIRVCLFEEGTAIYKKGVEGFQTFAEPTISQSMFGIYNRRLKSNLIFREVIMRVAYTLYQLWLLLISPLTIIKDIYHLPQLQKLFLKRKWKGFISGWYDFDTVYASNPDVLRGVFHSNEYVESVPSFNDKGLIEGAKQIAEEYAIDENTAIFASQSFPVDTKIFVTLIMRFLHQLAETNDLRILIKLHPREKPAIVGAYERLLEMDEYRERIVLLNPTPVPAEYIALNSDCRTIVSISSSTLMYAPKHKQLRAISIGYVLLEALTRAGVDQKTTNQIKSHIDILKPIPYVEHVT